jgi:hypothetical protein
MTKTVAPVLNQLARACLELIKMTDTNTSSNLIVENIDSLHDELYGKSNPFNIENVYSKIRANPLKYILANGYFKKLLFFTISPFVFLIFFFNLFIAELDLSEYLKLSIVLTLIWIWFNRNTCYIFIKLLMLLYAIFPFTNLYYHVTGQLIHIRFVKVSLCIVFTIISFQIAYQVIIS